MHAMPVGHIGFNSVLPVQSNMQAPLVQAGTAVPRGGCAHSEACVQGAAQTLCIIGKIPPVRVSQVSVPRQLGSFEQGPS